MAEDSLKQSKLHVTDGDVEFEVFTVNGYALPPFPPAFGEGFPKRILDVQNLDTRPDDILLLTYPKCGTHWTNEIVNMLLQGKADYIKEMKVAAMMEALPSLAILDRLPTPRVINTHFAFRWIPKKHIENGGKIIHVTRNPKDTYTSLFHHAKSSLELGPKTKNLTWTQFFNNCVAETGKVKMYDSWFAYEREISDAKKDNKHILTVHFENLKKSPEQEIRRIGQFLNVDTSDQLIRDIAEKCQFSNLKSGSEKNKEYPKEFIKVLEEHSKSNPDARPPIIFRKGVIGDWKNHFTVAQNEQFDKMFEKEMKTIDLEVIF